MRGRPSPEPKSLRISRYPFYGDTPQRPGKRSGADDALCPAGPDGPAPEGAAFNADGPARTLKPAVMVSCAGKESRQSPAFRLHEQVSDTASFQGAVSFAAKSRWSLARRDAWAGESESLAGFAVTG